MNIMQQALLKAKVITPDHIQKMEERHREAEQRRHEVRVRAEKATRNLRRARNQYDTEREALGAARTTLISFKQQGVRQPLIDHWAAAVAQHAEKCEQQQKELDRAEEEARQALRAIEALEGEEG